MKRGERVHESAVRSNPGLAEKIVRGHPVILSKNVFRVPVGVELIEYYL